MAALVTAGIGTGMLVTDKVKLAVPAPPVLVADNEMEELPTTVGVPEISPVTVFKLKPAGRLAAAYEVGLLEAVI